MKKIIFSFLIMLSLKSYSQVNRELILLPSYNDGYNMGKMFCELNSIEALNNTIQYAAEYELYDYLQGLGDGWYGCNRYGDAVGSGLSYCSGVFLSGGIQAINADSKCRGAFSSSSSQQRRLVENLNIFSKVDLNTIRVKSNEDLANYVIYNFLGIKIVENKII